MAAYKGANDEWRQAMWPRCTSDTVEIDRVKCQKCPCKRNHTWGRRDAAVIRKDPRTHNKQFGFQPNHFLQITTGMLEAPERPHDGLQIMFDDPWNCSLQPWRDSWRNKQQDLLEGGDGGTLRAGTFSGVFRFQLLEDIGQKNDLQRVGQESSHVELGGGLEEDPEHVSQPAWKLLGIPQEMLSTCDQTDFSHSDTNTVKNMDAASCSCHS